MEMGIDEMDENDFRSASFKTKVRKQPLTRGFFAIRYSIFPIRSL